MATNPENLPADDTVEAPSDVPRVEELPPEEFEAEFGEALIDVLDLATWKPGADLEGLYGRLDAEIADAVEEEDHRRGTLREMLFTWLGDKSRPQAPPLAGIWQLGVEDIERIHR